MFHQYRVRETKPTLRKLDHYHELYVFVHDIMRPWAICDQIREKSPCGINAQNAFLVP